MARRAPESSSSPLSLLLCVCGVGGAGAGVLMGGFWKCVCLSQRWPLSREKKGQREVPIFGGGSAQKGLYSGFTIFPSFVALPGLVDNQKNVGVCRMYQVRT